MSVPLAGRRSRPVSAHSLANVLHASTFVPSLSERELQRIERDIVERRIGIGAHVVLKGDPVEHWILVVDGMVKIEATASDGRTTTLAGMPRGSWFGEGSLLKGGCWPFDAISSAPTTVGLLPRATFEWLLGQSVAFNRFLLDQLNARLGQFIERCEHLRFCAASAHVAHCLAELFDDRLCPCADRQLPLSQEEVAHLAGISRPTANRALRELEQQGVLSIAYGAITVHDTETLRRLGSRH